MLIQVGETCSSEININQREAIVQGGCKILKEAVNADVIQAVT